MSSTLLHFDTGSLSYKKKKNSNKKVEGKISNAPINDEILWIIWLASIEIHTMANINNQFDVYVLSKLHTHFAQLPLHYFGLIFMKIIPSGSIKMIG